MVIIKQTNEIQRFGLTLSEMCSLKNPLFLFVFLHDSTNEIQKVVLNQLLASNSRCNYFELPGVFFKRTGWFSYEVYEQDNLINVETLKAVSLVETGRFYVAAAGEMKIANYENEIKITEYAGN